MAWRGRGTGLLRGGGDALHYPRNCCRKRGSSEGEEGRPQDVRSSQGCHSSGDREAGEEKWSPGKQFEDGKLTEKL